MMSTRLSVSLVALVVGLGACGGAAPTPAAPPTSATQPSAPGAVPSQPKPPAIAKPATDLERLTTTCRDSLGEANRLLGVLRAASAPYTVANTVAPLHELLIATTNADTISSLFAVVHPDAAVRAAAEACAKDTSAFLTAFNLDPRIYQALAAVDVSGLDADGKRFVELRLRELRRAGVDKDDATRARLLEIEKRLVDLGLTFGRNIREDVRTVKLDPADLEGLPADYVAARKPDADGKVAITTDYPDYLPFRTYAVRPAARKALFLEFQNRGWPKNEAVFLEILALRQEKAKLLGFRDWADYITADKMVRSADAAQAFIDKVAKTAGPRAKADLAAILAEKRKDVRGAKVVEEHERVFYAERLKKARFAVDSQEVRKYFEYGRTRDGLLALTSRLFGVEYRAVADAWRWHPEVDVYDVYDQASGEKLGRIYLDMHPREGKYKHAAQFTLRRGVKGKQLPEAALVCNFANPRTESPALMDHDQVKVMFHEFGHLLHDILAGRQGWVTQAGVATEWDFVEAPSQLLEEWAWDTATLQTFATHVETGAPIPAELVARMRTANELGKGIDARQQMYYAGLSLAYHRADPKGLDLLATAKKLQAKYSPFRYVEGTHFYSGFGHLESYSAMYYTYMWSLVIAKDMWSAFDGKAGEQEAIARRYRQAILEPGGTRDAAVLVESFLGRPYGFEAYRRWLER